MFDLLYEFIKKIHQFPTQCSSPFWKTEFIPFGNILSRVTKRYREKSEDNNKKNDYEVEDSLTMKDQNIYSIVERERNYTCIIDV